jgi:hypothetical protein
VQAEPVVRRRHQVGYDDVQQDLLEARVSQTREGLAQPD